MKDRFDSQRICQLQEYCSALVPRIFEHLASPNYDGSIVVYITQHFEESIKFNDDMDHQ